MNSCITDGFQRKVRPYEIQLCLLTYISCSFQISLCAGCGIRRRRHSRSGTDVRSFTKGRLPRAGCKILYQASGHRANGVHAPLCNAHNARRSHTTAVLYLQIFKSENTRVCYAKVRVKSGVFCDVTPCGSCKNRRFIGT
jgi:hypothetical protein